MSFKGDTQKFKKKAMKAATLVIRGTALDLSASIIRRTPVQTGRLRGNWQTELNSLASGEVTTTPAAAIARNKGAIGKAKIADSIYLVNNLPYAPVVERGNWSKQAPAGMVRVTINAFKRIVQKNARRAKR